MIMSRGDMEGSSVRYIEKKEESNRKQGATIGEIREDMAYRRGGPE